MEMFRVDKEINVFGFEVKTFPKGIGEAFDALVSKIPGGFSRDYYGIGFQDGMRIIYLATALELEYGEAEKYQCNRYTIEKGDYAVQVVWDWRKKTDSIKGVFDNMFSSANGTLEGPCIEWYKDNNEMLCMVRLSRGR